MNEEVNLSVYLSYNTEVRMYIYEGLLADSKESIYRFVSMLTINPLQKPPFLKCACTNESEYNMTKGDWDSLG